MPHDSCTGADAFVQLDDSSSLHAEVSDVLLSIAKQGMLAQGLEPARLHESSYRVLFKLRRVKPGAHAPSCVRLGSMPTDVCFNAHVRCHTI